MHESIGNKIDNLGLCVGCGMCASVYKDGQMKLEEDGFLHPYVPTTDKEADKVIKKVCPGINLIGNQEKESFDQLWGKSLLMEESYSNDSEVRFSSTSGGIVSSICIFLLQKKMIDGVLHVGGNINDFSYNHLKVSKTKEEVLNNASSRYAPAHVFDDLHEILQHRDKSYAFVGKPCDVATLGRYLDIHPEFKQRVKLTIGIFCAGVPSINATKKLVSSKSPRYPVSNLRYRGNGWPGYFSFNDSAGVTHKETYNDSWGKTLGKELSFRCKICPDGLGILADFAVGDSWETKDGYPDFEEKEGISLAICRTERALKVWKQMKLEKTVTSWEMPEGKLSKIQPYQLRRRKFSSIRALAFSTAKFYWFPTTKSSNFKHVPWREPKKVFKEFIGTLMRTIGVIKSKR